MPSAGDPSSGAQQPYVPRVHGSATFAGVGGGGSAGPWTMLAAGAAKRAITSAFVFAVLTLAAAAPLPQVKTTLCTASEPSAMLTYVALGPPAAAPAAGGTACSKPVQNAKP